MATSKLTRERVRAILGRDRIDDARIIAVLATDATEDELVEAIGRSQRLGLGAIVKRPMSARVDRLCQILSEAQEEGWGDER